MNKLVSFLIITLFFLIGLTQSCRPFSPSENELCCEKADLLSDTTFYPYKERFEFYSGVDVRSFPIHFANLRSGIAGVCYYVGFFNGFVQWKYIEIDKKYWGVISEYQRINLIFHELGHCVLGRDHVSWKDFVTKCPSSLMYESVIDTECIKDNYDAYLKEMFPNWRANEI